MMRMLIIEDTFDMMVDEMKCRKKYFGFKNSEEYVAHCKTRLNGAKSNNAKEYWRHNVERGSAY